MMFRNITKTILAALSAMLIFSCAKVEEPDYREKSYGYVQFKLYKAASYTKAAAEDEDVLQYLSDATKIKVELSDGDRTISQTLVLNSSGPESAEYGLRSDKMKLLAGEYRIFSFTLYGKLDEQIYMWTSASSVSNDFVVVPGGLCIHDILANTVERGKVKFTLVKDTTAFVATKSNSRTREYTFDEIKSIKLRVRRSDDFVEDFGGKALPAKFSLHFLDNGDPTDGYMTSTVVCDTLLPLIAGEYTIDYYEVFDNEKGTSLLERNENVKASFVVEDNVVSEPKVPVRFYQSDEYIKDYYALKAIWEALDGENWYYSGEDFPTGANWDFNKDCDLWGDQPGVSLHSNGRVALISVSDFGFRGHLPAEIAQLSELTELYLGTHNDNNQNEFDPTLQSGTANRMERHKEYLSNRYPAVPMSEPIARALKEHDLTIPATAMYETMTEDELIERGTGRTKIGLKDAVPGKLYNGLTSIDPAIWSLDKLERLTIANGLLENFPKKPETMQKDKGLIALTDLEIYNCSKLNNPKEALSAMPSLISVNLSQNNPDWSSEEANDILHSFAYGKSAQKIQILYMNKSNLTYVDGGVLRQMKSLGLLDLSDNKIKTVTAFGKDINLVQLHLNNNQIESLSRGENGEAFCGMADVETFSVRNNKIKAFPDIFDAKAIYGMASVDFSYNDITHFEGYDENGLKTTGSKGIYVETLTLANNPIKVFPHYFKDTESKTAYINMRGCLLEEFADSTFCYDNAVYLTSFDFSYNRLKDLPRDFHAGNIPYLYGLDLSYNSFSKFPFEQFDMAGLTVFAIRGQRDENGERCLREWPSGVYQHVGLRGLYLGSNDIRVVNETISSLCYYLDISDNPNIVFDASDICYYWQIGMYYLIYDKTQNIIGCDLMLQ
jgi:Leucine-rich repeat (LRR) protein